MKTPKLFFILSLTILLPLFSCGKFTDKTAGNNSNDDTKLSVTNPPVNDPGTDKVKMKDLSVQKEFKKDSDFRQVSDVLDVVNRMVIKTGTMNLETEKYDESINQISDYVKKAGGFITNSSSQVNASGKKQGAITIRITSDKYDAMVKDMSNFGKVLNSQINGSDVTSEYIDLQARMNTQGELEKRLLTLLNDKTAKLIDVVSVEEKLASVRESIEKIQGRMKFLKNQTDFSTLTVSVYEPSLMTTSSGGGFFYEIGRGFSKGLKGFTEILSGMITFFIALMPVVILLLILAYIAILIYKKSKARKLKTA
ncbi:MAG: DUF4349 domain-containing protein [Bacteroidetes bacterium]|nr:DUF4349 domain-containing protein [Bacteroidota bacterium]